MPDGSNLVKVKASTTPLMEHRIANQLIRRSKLFVIARKPAPSLCISIKISPKDPSEYCLCAIHLVSTHDCLLRIPFTALWHFFAFGFDDLDHNLFHDLFCDDGGLFCGVPVSVPPSSSSSIKAAARVVTVWTHHDTAHSLWCPKTSSAHTL